ncbi:hypothetical protein [Novosphingobium sp.]|uniref:hypothetical protein n=1 Tax=Novosphingobium sp. TaxID=1874826 RepID=UPI0031E382EB
MQHEASGPVPPQPVPHTYARRPIRTPDRRMQMIVAAVERDGAAYSPFALEEQTGLSLDGIRRFAAQAVVAPRKVMTPDGLQELNMVELGMIRPEDAIRMGSEALAASLRIALKSHMDGKPEPARHVVRAADLLRMRRLPRGRGDKRPVVAPRTMCPRCGARSDVDGGCKHQRALVPADTIEKGRPHA